LAVFGSDFLVRPLGGVLLTAGIGLLSTTAQAGLLAPVLLVALRLVQGFFACGEVIGAATFVAESAPEGRRGFFKAFTLVGVALSGVLAAIVCGITTTVVGGRDAGLVIGSIQHGTGQTVDALLTSVDQARHTGEAGPYGQRCTGDHCPVSVGH